MSALRRYLIAGLLVWAPLAVTLWLINLLVDLLDQTLLLLPTAWHPDTLLGFRIPGLGVLLSLALLLVTGVVAANLFGRKLVALWERFLARIPLVRSVYSGSKQLFETMFTPAGQSFRKVLLVEYPRKGVWTLAFQTAAAPPAITRHAGVAEVGVYVPTTPNPTSGFLLWLPKSEIIELDMNVDEGLRLLLTLGTAAQTAARPISPADTIPPPNPAPPTS
jgi:uncharacterized membrane protein